MGGSSAVGRTDQRGTSGRRRDVLPAGRGKSEEKTSSRDIDIVKDCGSRVR